MNYKKDQKKKGPTVNSDVYDGGSAMKFSFCATPLTQSDP